VRDLRRLSTPAVVREGERGPVTTAGRRQVRVFVACFLGAILVGAALYNPKNVVEASPEASTYEFSDLIVVYPYQDPRTQTTDTTSASVSYKTNWSTSEYPGLVDCEFVLRDASGAVVGTHGFELSSASPTQPHAFSSDPIPVSRPPASAEGRCEEGTYSAEAGYRFSNPKIGRNERGGARLTFDVGWDGDVHPAMRTCTVVVAYSDGSSRQFGPFGFHLSRSEPFEFDLPPRDSLKGIRGARIDCSPIG
jgi:hypothetical protein